MCVRSDCIQSIINGQHINIFFVQLASQGEKIDEHNQVVSLGGGEILHVINALTSCIYENEVCGNLGKPTDKIIIHIRAYMEYYKVSKVENTGNSRDIDNSNSKANHTIIIKISKSLVVQKFRRERRSDGDSTLPTFVKILGKVKVTVTPITKTLPGPGYTPDCTCPESQKLTCCPPSEVSKNLLRDTLTTLKKVLSLQVFGKSITYS